MIRTLALATALLAAPAAFAQTDVKCPRSPDLSFFTPGPVVRDPEVAQGIYVAVMDQFMGGEDWTGWEIKVHESDDHRFYIVDRYRPHTRGGGRTMTIDRCTGAVVKLQSTR